MCWKMGRSLFLLFFIILLLYWGYVVTFAKVLRIYHGWIHPLHHSTLSPHFHSHSWNSFNRSHFSFFIHEYIIFSLHSLSYTVSLYPTSSYWLFYLPVLTFWKKTFLFKIAVQGVLLCPFHEYMYYNPNWFIPSILLSILVSFLWWLQQV
jgi:hypothetical protein